MTPSSGIVTVRRSEGVKGHSFVSLLGIFWGPCIAERAIGSIWAIWDEESQVMPFRTRVGQHPVHMGVFKTSRAWVSPQISDYKGFLRFSICFFKTKTLKCGEVRHRKVQYHQFGSSFQLPSVDAGEALSIGYEHCLSLAPPPTKYHSSVLCKAPPPTHQIGNSEYCPSITVHSWCPGHRSCKLFWSSWAERKGKTFILNHGQIMQHALMGL